MTILHSDGDSRWEIDNEKVVKPMIGNILDLCAARVNQSKKGVTLGDFMKRKRGGNIDQSETSPPSATKHLTPAFPLEERGWECVDCRTENAEEDHTCWICKVGTKGEAGEKGPAIGSPRPADWARK